jgi:large subunit ribosomal protein L18
VSYGRMISQRKKRRVARVGRKLRASEFPRVRVFRSNSSIYAQLIDDTQHRTIVSFSSLNLEKPSGDKTAIAHAVGLELAKLAQAANIDRIAFDRGGYRYHGRVKSLAQGLRDGGLQL